MQSKHIKANPKVNEEYDSLRHSSSYFDTLAEEQYSFQDHCTDKYSSMTICAKHNLELENYEYIPILNAIKFDLVDTRLRESQSLPLLYRKNNSNIPRYMEALQHIISSSRIDMIHGDFNINYLNEIHSQPLSFMESLNYTQIVTKPTFVPAGM